MTNYLITSLRQYQQIEKGIISRLRLEHLKSGSELSFEEYLILKQEPKSPLSKESGVPVFNLKSNFEKKSGK